MDTKALRQKILDLAIRGQLVPQDPADEPASVLLKRIRAEKQQMVKDGKLKAKDIKNDTVIFVGEDSLHYEKFADGSVKCIEDEIPFELPEGWEWSRLASVCCLISDIDHKMPKAVDNGVLFLSAKDLLNDGTINFTDDVKMISEEDFLRLSRKALPQKNDIIYSRIGACLGKARVVTKDIRFLVSYSCCTIRPVIIDSTFLASILDGNFVLDQAKEGTQSVGVPDLGMASIKQFLIPIPPLVEQQRIDDRLQYVLNIVQQISNKRDDLSRVVAQTKSKVLDLAIRGQLVPQDPADEPAYVLLERIHSEKEALIKAGKLKRDKKESIIFKGDDNSYYEKIGGNVSDFTVEEIPLGWTVASFSQINMFNTETLDPSRFPDDIFELYSVPNFDLGMPEIVRSQEIGSTKQIIHEKDVLVCKINPRINRVWITGHITPHRILGSSEWIVFRNEMLYAPYIQYYFSSPYFRNLLLSNVSGVGGSLMRAQPESVKKYPILIPPYQEQVRISERIGKLFSLLSVIEKSLS